MFVSVLVEEGFQRFRWTGVRQRAARVEVRQDDFLVGIQYFGGLRHEMDSAKGDHLGFRFCRLNGEAEGIAHKIRDFLDFFYLIIVRQDNGVSLLFEFVDFLDQIET